MTPNDSIISGIACGLWKLLCARERRHCDFQSMLLRMAVFACCCTCNLSLEAAPKKNVEPPVEPSIGKNVELRMERGAECRVDLQGVVFPGNQAEFKIVAPPACGVLTLAGRSMDTASYIYRHDGKAVGEDSFRFKLKTGPTKAWGYYHARIEVVEPLSRLRINHDELEFGEVFLGDTGQRDFAISNAGGGQLIGRAQTGAPWALEGDEEFSLASGAARRVLVEFRPTSEGEVKGVLEIEDAVGAVNRVTLTGIGRYKIQAPPRVDFPAVPGPAEMVLPIRNLVDKPLTLTLDIPAPLECDEKQIVLLPLGSSAIPLRVPSRHYLEKKVTVGIICDGSTCPVMVNLPPSPPLLEWTAGPLRDLGVKAVGATLSLEAELRNASPQEARVALRLEGEGMSLEGLPLREIIIPATETRKIKLLWQLPRLIGAARAALVATAGGLDQSLSWQVVLEPAPLVEGPAPVQPVVETVPPSASTHKGLDIRMLSEKEKAALNRFFPRDISYRLEAEWRSATAIISWELSKGIAGERVQIERLVARRPDMFGANPLEKRLQLPGELPAPSIKSEWVRVPPDEALVRQREDGRWEARVTGLEEGFHRLKLLVPESQTKSVHGHDFVVEVGKIPHSSARTWSLISVVLVLLIYLLRKIIRINP